MKICTCLFWFVLINACFLFINISNSVFTFSYTSIWLCQYWWRDPETKTLLYDSSVFVSLWWYQNSKLLNLCGINSPATAGFLSQRDSNQEYIFMSWHQHWIRFVLSVTFIQHFAIPMVVDVEFVMIHESIWPDIMPLWAIWLAGYMYKQKWTFVINENQYTAKTKLVLIHNNIAI